MSGRNQKTNVKVKRYRAGQAPDGAGVYDDSSSDEEIKNEIIKKEDSPTYASTTLNTTLDPRLQRFNNNKVIRDKMEVANRYAERYKDESESESEEEIKKEEEYDSDASVDRQQLRREALQRQNNINDEQVKAKSESEEESEYSTESSSEEEQTILLKPVFVPKSQRITLQEKEKRQKELEELELQKQKLKLQHKEDSKKLVEQVVRKELEEAVIQAELITEVDDTDGLDPEAEKQAWRLREFTRIKRDKQEKVEREKEQAEIERRRNLTEEERIKEDLEKVEKQQKEKEKKKESNKKHLLQRYHHKGAFYMDKQEEIFKRDFNDMAPDAIKNVEALPDVLKVKKFGLAGRTKYTHLVDQDTSNKESPWYQGNAIVDKSLKRMGGMHDSEVRKRREDKKE